MENWKAIYSCVFQRQLTEVSRRCWELSQQDEDHSLFTLYYIVLWTFLFILSLALDFVWNGFNKSNLAEGRPCKLQIENDIVKTLQFSHNNNNFSGRIGLSGNWSIICYKMRLNLKCLVWLLVSRSMIRGVVLTRAEQAGDKHFLCKSNDNAAPDSLSVCPSLPCYPPLTITLCKNNNLANLVFQHPTVRQKVVTLLRQDRFSHNENPSWKYF